MGPLDLGRHQARASELDLASRARNGLGHLLESPELSRSRRVPQRRVDRQGCGGLCSTCDDDGFHSMTATNVDADAVNTIEWLETQSEIAVPVYQRHYRWDIDRCRRLLDDIRAAGDPTRNGSHFIGSILSTRTSSEEPIVLIDGQQRIATLFLIVAAVYESLPVDDPDRAAFGQLLEHPRRRGQPRLLLRGAQREVLERLLVDHQHRSPGAAGSPIEDNYQFILSEIRRNARLVAQGLRRLEHVVIFLGEGSNPQQVFESLNSTSAPLQDHELIHNYVLMGLSYDQQHHVEETYWKPIEECTGESIDQFFRSYLIQRTGRDTQFLGEHGIFDAFKATFRDLSPESIETDSHAPEWLEFAQVYRDIVDPDNPNVTDEDIRNQLHGVGTFGTAMYPVVMATYRDWKRSTLGTQQLNTALDALQALYLRRMVVGQTRDHLAAQLCRRRNKYGGDRLLRGIARRSPSDERVRAALQHRRLPRAGYVLRRLDPTAADLTDLEIEHIFPQTPSDTWSGEARGRIWAEFSVDEKARYQELANTLGNLILLEQPLNAGASNRPFDEKRTYYADSEIASVQELATVISWGDEAIAQRTARLTEQFLQIWRRPTDEVGDTDAEYLTPVLDAERRTGHYRGWKTELSFARFCGDIWEVRNHKELYSRVFKELWATRRSDVVAYCEARKNPPIGTVREPGISVGALDDAHFLYTGLFPQYALAETQRVLDELGIADEVYVKYADDDE